MKKYIIIDDMSPIFKLILEAIEHNGVKSEVIITDVPPSTLGNAPIAVVGRTASGRMVILGHESKLSLQNGLIGEELRKKAEGVLLALTREMPMLDLGDLKDFVVMKKPSPKFPRQTGLPPKFRGKNSQYAKKRH